VRETASFATSAAKPGVQVPAVSSSADDAAVESQARKMLEAVGLTLDSH
jgi:hypothetical protein